MASTSSSSSGGIGIYGATRPYKLVVVVGNCSPMDTNSYCYSGFTRYWYRFLSGMA